MGDSSMVDPSACVLVGAISTSDDRRVRARALDAFGDFNSTHALYDDAKRHGRVVIRCALD